jgi:hypothetical protein
MNENKVEMQNQTQSESTDASVRSDDAIRALYEVVQPGVKSSPPKPSHITLVVFWLVSIAVFTTLVIAFIKMPNGRFAISLLGAGLLVTIILLKGPKWQLANLKGLTPDQLFDKENEARKTLAQIIGGILVLAGLYYTQDNIRITQEVAEKSRDLAREGQITDRFTKAVEQLGRADEPGKGSNLAIRLGGIYALERIANESNDDHWPIMELLTAYVRQHSLYKGKDPKAGQDVFEADADIQAIMTVIGRRNVKYESEEQRINLTGADLRGIKLYHANLNRALLGGADLRSAIFNDVHLEQSWLFTANLSRAYLPNANFREADFGGMVYIKDTNLIEADLRGVKHLTCANLNEAQISDRTKLDPELSRCPE